MEANYKPFKHLDSAQRLTDILDQSDIDYQEKDELPSRDQLTFSNGFYAYCSVACIDIRDSSSLPQQYRRPKLARLYRAFISECVAILNGDERCREVNVAGDGVWCVVNTPKKAHIDTVFSNTARLNSVVKMLNCKSRSRDFAPIKAGIGVSYGRALMIKAGYAGSGLNEVVYMGDVVNEAAKLASFGMRELADKAIMASSVFQQNLNDHNRGLLSYNSARGCYHGDVINKAMEGWYKDNCT